MKVALADDHYTAAKLLRDHDAAIVRIGDRKSVVFANELLCLAASEIIPHSIQGSRHYGYPSLNCPSSVFLKAKLEKIGEDEKV